MTTNVASRFFTMAEMRCRDGTEYPTMWVDRLVELFSQFDIIREAYGYPLIVVSGYRSPAHNKAIGGAEQSQHPEGRAGDLRPFKKNLSVGDIHRLHDVIEHLIGTGKLPLVGGVGLYPLTRDTMTKLLFPGWVHVDCRPKPASGHICRWTGEKFGDEQSV